MNLESDRVRARSKPPVVVLALCALLGAIGAFLPAAAAPQPRTDAQDRSRLLELQRQAVTQLQQAARPRKPVEQVRRALLEASRNLDALGAAPAPGAAPATTPSTTRFDPSLRDELRRAAATVRALASGDVRAVASSTAPVLALLEKVRAQI